MNKKRCFQVGGGEREKRSENVLRALSVQIDGRGDVPHTARIASHVVRTAPGRPDRTAHDEGKRKIQPVFYKFSTLS